MSVSKMNLVADAETVEPRWKDLYRIGGIAALILLVYSLVTMVILIVIGGQPKTAQEGFAMLQENRLVAGVKTNLYQTRTPRCAQFVRMNRSK